MTFDCIVIRKILICVRNELACYCEIALNNCVIFIGLTPELFLIKND